MGMTRRMQHYADPSWQPYLIVAECGALIILCGILATLIQLIVSIRARDRHRDLTGDPWNGRTLEWSTSSPPPLYNFAVLPRVESLDAYWYAKQSLMPRAAPAYEDIELPPNSANGFITALFASITGFALVWHIWWMVLFGLACAGLTLLVFGWVERHETLVSGSDLAAAENARLLALNNLGKRGLA
jgi:cytochrome o ubiquinol oxidase subunit 1